MVHLDEPHSEPSLVGSLGRVIEAGQRIVVNRIDLVRVDVLDIIARTVRGSAMVVIGGVILLVGWVALSCAAILVGEMFVSLPASAAIVGLANAALGAAFVTLGVERTAGKLPPTLLSEPGNGRDTGSRS